MPIEYILLYLEKTHKYVDFDTISTYFPQMVGDTQSVIFH